MQVSMQIHVASELIIARGTEYPSATIQFIDSYMMFWQAFIHPTAQGS